jgi:hypothetical protein
MPIRKGKPIEPYGYNSIKGKNPRAYKTRKEYINIDTKTEETKEIKKYTVWVGGTEITDFFVTYSIAKELLKQYNALGYTDVIIQEGR